jgi:predicted CXXCH cytochrome family protein
MLLVLFVALYPAGVGAQTYVGSQTCMPCHKAIYKDWQGTLHNKSQQILSPTNDPVVVNWQGTVKLEAGKIPEASIKLSKGKDGTYVATLVDSKDPSKEASYQVARTYGGWGWKQRYQVKIGNNHYILPIQWNQATSRWVPYNLQNWYNEDGSLKKPPVSASFDLSCAGCHNTGLRLKKIDGGYESTYTELNTGCEKCHGHGSKHVKSPKTKGSIINPRKLGYERAIEVCGQCHSRGSSVPGGLFGYAWDERENRHYRPGERLSNYYQPKPGVWPEPEMEQAHSRQHHQQWHDLLRSGHYQAKIGCFDCHNPHGGAGRFQLITSDFDNDLCLSCHGKDKRFASPGAIMRHTKHQYAPETRGTSRCSLCHMVKTASSAEAADIHSHDFAVIKPMVSMEMFKKDPKAVLPNSCNGCHQEWAKDQAGYEAGAAAYQALFGK